MDIRFPEFPAPRDAGSDPAARKSHAENSDFAEMLDRSLDEPQHSTREVANEKPREPRAAERDDADVRANEATTVRDAAVEPQAEPAAAPQSSPDAAKQHHGQPAKQPDGVGGRVDDTAAATADTPLAAASGQPTIPPVPAPVAPGAVAAAPSAPAAHPQGAAQTAIAGPNAAAPAEVAAQPPVPHVATGAAPAQPAFADELMAAASVNPTEPVAAKPKSAQKNDAKPAAAASATPPVPTPTITVAAVPETKAAPHALPKNASTVAEQTPAVQTSASSPIPDPATATNTATVGTTADVEAGTTDDAQIAALVRPAANGAGAERPAGSKDTVRSDTSPADLLAKEPAVDAKPSDQARPETPSRPFGAVAPGLSIAAQAAAQQTPEQANAAERLAQLAAAADPEQTVKPGQAAADAPKGTDSGPSVARTDQAGQIDSAAPRNTVTETAATSAARAARPAAHPMITHIAAHVAQAAIDGNDRISIRLSPAELGRIEVKLEIGHDGRIQAVFAADRAQTVDLLQRDARDLERALQDAGLRADSGSLSFNLRGDGRNGAGDGGAGRGSREEPVAEASNPQLQAYAAGGGSTGRLDLRI